MSDITIGTALPRTTASRRYTAVAIVLHWAIGLAILFQLAMGLYMVQYADSLDPGVLFAAYQLHKSIGLTILMLVLVRIAWRLFHSPPPLPADLPRLEKRAAHGTHLVLYAGMLAMPLTGWAMVSASVYNIPTVLFGLMPWPHLPVLATLHDKAPVEDAFKAIHAYIGFGLIAFVGLHASAALRHQIFKHDDVLWRMLPLWRRPRAASLERISPCEPS